MNMILLPLIDEKEDDRRPLAAMRERAGVPSWHPSP